MKTSPKYSEAKALSGTVEGLEGLLEADDGELLESLESVTEMLVRALVASVAWAQRPRSREADTIRIESSHVTVVCMGN